MSEATRAARKGCGFAAKLFGPGGILAAAPALCVAVKVTSTPNSRLHDHYGLIKMLKRHNYNSAKDTCKCYKDSLINRVKTHFQLCSRHFL